MGAQAAALYQAFADAGSAALDFSAIIKLLDQRSNAQA
jgi:3-hydroxyisobutyrate dehydrogenase-like beta-hydroxyacid dehydrogenase